MDNVQNNKTNIMNRALELFSKKGFDGTSTMDIITAAKVSKPTMYHYFGSKEGLLEHILNCHYNELIANLATATTLPEDISLTVFRIIKVYFDTALRNIDFFRFRAGLMLRVGEDTAYLISKPYIKEETNIIKSFFDTASKQAGNIKGKEDLCRISLEGTINATISAYLHTGDNSLLSDENIYRIRQQFLYGIYS